MKTTKKAEAHPNFARESILHYVARVRAVAQLLVNVSNNRYECQGAWEEFGMQMEALSEALLERVDTLAGVVDERIKPAKAA